MTRTALVTGASRGIGRVIAIRLAADGAEVAVHYGRDAPAAKQTVAEIEQAGGRAFSVQAEFGTPGAVEALFAQIDGDLDILVNNAGIAGAGVLDEVREDDVDRLLAVNAKAPLFVAQQAARRMRNGGRIVNITTGLTRLPLPRLLAYTMSKAAVDALTMTLAKELAPRGITVNAVAPGVIGTDMNPWLHEPGAKESVIAQTPLGRLGNAADVADVVAFLASDAARWLTGNWLDATGGALLGTAA